MNTSKFLWIPFSILIGMLVLTSVLAIPARATSGMGEVQQINNSAGKPPTRTKRPVKTSVPKATPVPKTATPRPTNTIAGATQTASTSSVVPAGTGTPASSTTPLPTFTFSSGLNTVVAQLTATSKSVFMTSTSAALTATSTPTTVGARTSTPSDLEQTATSIVLTTVPTNAYVQPTTTPFAEVSLENEKPPVTTNKSEVVQKRSKIMFWLLGIGLLVLFVLIYLLTRELKRSSAKNG